MPRTQPPARAGSWRGAIDPAQMTALQRQADAAPLAGATERDGSFARYATLALFGFVALGLAARARQFFGCPSYWYDEAYLVVNVIDRSYAGLIGPLRQCVVIPPLFLWQLRFLYERFGAAEWAMRLPAFAAGGAALALMIPLARRALPGLWWVLPVALAAASRHLVMHSYEVRPYTFDVLIAEAVLLAARVCLNPTGSARGRQMSGAGLLFLALVGPWVSFPSPFVLAGACAALLYDAYARRHSGWLIAAGVGAAVAVSAAALWWVQARHMYYPGLKEHWTEMGGFPAAASAPALLAWAWQCFVGIGQYGTTGMGVPLAILAAGGLAASWKRRPAVTILLATPVAVAVLAALAGKYPMVDRTVLFAVPCVWLLAAEGVCGLSLRLPRRHWQWLPIGLAAVLVAADVPRAAESVWAVSPRVDFRGAFDHVRRDGQPGDLRWVSHPEVYEVYFGKGETARISYAPAAAVVDEARGRRLWVIAPPAHPVKSYPWTELRACLRAAGIFSALHRSCFGLEIERYDPPAPAK